MDAIKEYLKDGSNLFYDKFIRSKTFPSYPSPRRTMNVAAITVGVLALTGLIITYYAGKTAYSITEGSLPLTAITSASACTAYTLGVRALVKPSFTPS